MDRLQRRELLESEARRISGALVERGATLVMVFGSVATGRVASTSDLDMIAVMESDLPFIRRLEELYQTLAPRVGLDLLVYTPKEWERMQGRAFIRRAIEDGKVMHAA